MEMYESFHTYVAACTYRACTYRVAKTHRMP